MRLRGAATTCAAVAACAAALAGCGGQGTPDLFGVQRSGTVHGARLEMAVNDDGTARCDGHKPVPIASSDLLDARQIARDLAAPAKRHVALPPRRGSVFTYRVTTPDGSVSFADNSQPTRPVFQRLAFLVLRLAQGPCRLSR